MDKAWVVSVNMGYGHQRTAHPLRSFAYKGQVICANDYKGIPKNDKMIWEESRRVYEAISKFKRAPLLGEAAFSVLNRFQKIFDFYPKKDLSQPSFTLKQIYSLIEKGWGRDLIERLSKKPLPLVTTFFTPAFMAEHFEYPEDIYVIVCDADINRAWAPRDPFFSRIKYFASNERTYERLKLYGVKKQRIFLSGYPLPLENISRHSDSHIWQMETLKHDLKNRLVNLDPKKTYQSKYKILIEKKIGSLPDISDHPLTLLFSIGGAGAQRDVGSCIIESLLPKIRQGRVKIIMSAGINEQSARFFARIFEKNRLQRSKFAQVLHKKSIKDYFTAFNKALRKTDILWTKPSELSFYASLGIPIVIAPAIGSQEDFNERWLTKSGFGIGQEDLCCVSEWLFDWIDRGYLAEAAMQGFVEGEKLGTYHIRRIVFGKHNP